MDWKTIHKPLEVIISGKTLSTSQTRSVLLATDSCFSTKAEKDADSTLQVYTYMAGIESVSLDATHWLTNQEHLRKKLNYRHLHVFANHWGYGCDIEGPCGWLTPEGMIYMDRDICVAYPIQTLFDEALWLSKI